MYQVNQVYQVNQWKVGGGGGFLGAPKLLSRKGAPGGFFYTFLGCSVTLFLLFRFPLHCLVKFIGTVALQ